MKPMKPASKLISPFDMNVWPKLVSIKYDGIRAVTSKGGVLSNSLKMIPNLYVQARLNLLPPGFDGELVLRGDAGKCYDNNQSAFMTVDGKPDFVFKVFDYTGGDCETGRTKPFYQRLKVVEPYNNQMDCVAIVEHHSIKSAAEVMTLYEQVRECGYEGLILRDPNAPYKYGRSTLNQEWGLKMKPYDPDEAIVVGFTELCSNVNESYTNELGASVRSKHQEGKVPAGTLGALVCMYGESQCSFKVGTGFTAKQRQEIWDNRDDYLRKLVRFKHQGITKSGVPRGPAVYLGWRDARDMGVV
jgi:DNA ligase-1